MEYSTDFSEAADESDDSDEMISVNEKMEAGDTFQVSADPEDQFRINSEDVDGVEAVINAAKEVSEHPGNSLTFEKVSVTLRKE